MRVLNYLALATTITFVPAVLADRTVGQGVDDTVIQTEVNAKIMNSDFIGGMGINLETRKGVVQLGGFTDDMEEGKKAAELAATVDGVVKVDNQLHAKIPRSRSSGQVVDDGVTTGRVKAAIAEGNFGDGFTVNVDTYAGVVLLTGFVDEQEDKDAAGDIAEKDPNTKSVINGINVLD